MHVTGPATATRHDLITYTVTVENLGPASATGVWVAFAAPDETEIVSISSGGRHFGEVAFWNLASLNPGTSIQFTVTVRVEHRGVLVAFAFAGSRNPDPSFSNNRDRMVTRVGSH